MAIFNKNNKVKTPNTPNLDADYLKEYASSNGVNMYSFIQGIRTLDSNYINNDNLIDRMTQDSIIASAIDMWTEDALQRDPNTKEIFHVELDTPDDYVETALSKGLSKELDRFLKDDLRMEKNLIPILKRVLTYGNCPVKLDFADKLADEKLELKESNLEAFNLAYTKMEKLFGDTTSTETKAIDDINIRA